VTKCRNITQDKNKLELELTKMEQTFNLINNDYEELKVEYQVSHIE
jgi:hypothetical protein